MDLTCQNSGPNGQCNSIAAHYSYSPAEHMLPISVIIAQITLLPAPDPRPSSIVPTLALADLSAHISHLER